jgi:hypothetical protein
MKPRFYDPASYRNSLPPRQSDAAWNRALAAPISDPADAALHDLQKAAHRPGGKILPRPRFSKDERNKFGNWS